MQVTRLRHQLLAEAVEVPVVVAVVVAQDVIFWARQALLVPKLPMEAVSSGNRPCPIVCSIQLISSSPKI